jgi:sugar lactone lactonase YvrE
MTGHKTPHVELVLDAQNSVGESPIWHSPTQALFWVDIVNRAVFSFLPGSGGVRQWQFPEMVGAIAHVENDRWLLAMESGIFTATLGASPQPGDLQMHLAAQHPSDAMRFNDGRCDRQGRFLVSSMVNDMSAAKKLGSLVQLSQGGAKHYFRESLIVGNGLAFSRDGNSMFLSDSHPSVQKVWRHSYDTESGIPGAPALFVDFTTLDGRPDGAAVDVDDCYWICANDGSAVYRFTPEGRLDRVIKLPVKKPSMCAFGGSNLDTLFVTSIRPNGVDLSDQPLAGGVFALDTGTQGIPEPAFRFLNDTSILN